MIKIKKNQITIIKYIVLLVFIFPEARSMEMAVKITPESAAQYHRTYKKHFAHVGWEQQPSKTKKFKRCYDKRWLIGCCCDGLKSWIKHPIFKETIKAVGVGTVGAGTLIASSYYCDENCQLKNEMCEVGMSLFKASLLLLSAEAAGFIGHEVTKEYERRKDQYY